MAHGEAHDFLSVDIRTLAVRYAFQAYAPRAGTQLHYCAFDHFWLASEIFGFIKYDEENRAFVVFRGTETVPNPGNWLFANLQPYRMPFDVVDPELDSSVATGPRRRLQGAWRVPLLSGQVHQGFLRAFSWLWYGSDAHRELTPSGGPWRALLAYLPIAAAVWWWKGATAGVAAFAVQMALGRGVVESLFRRREARNEDRDEHRGLEGRPLSEARTRLAECKVVYFVGHSLGGAIAALAFTAYRAWSSTRDVNNAYLVTFGAPPLGDSELTSAFETMHHDRYRHIVHVGDPIAQLPPRARNALQALRYCHRGGACGLVLGLLIFAGYPAWRFYCLLYGMEGESSVEGLAVEEGESFDNGRPVKKVDTAWRWRSPLSFTVKHHFAYLADWKTWSRTPPS